MELCCLRCEEVLRRQELRDRLIAHAKTCGGLGNNLDGSKSTKATRNENPSQHADPVYSCEFCFEEFASSKTLKSHIVGCNNMGGQ